MINKNRIFILVLLSFSSHYASELKKVFVPVIIGRIANDSLQSPTKKVKDFYKGTQVEVLENEPIIFTENFVTCKKNKFDFDNLSELDEYMSSHFPTQLPLKLLMNDDNQITSAGTTLFIKELNGYKIYFYLKENLTTARNYLIQQKKLFEQKNSVSKTIQQPIQNRFGFKSGLIIGCIAVICGICLYSLYRK